jgi:guanyl-specific ribonuclease Sa
MSSNPSPTQRKPGSNPLPPWLVIVLFVVVLAVSWWQTHLPPPDNGPPTPDAAQNSKPNPNATGQDSGEESGPVIRPIDVEVADEPGGDTRGTKPATTRIKNQVIRNQDGTVVFRGTIDLQPTLDRIERGGRNSHRNDGSTFQNRERKLPAKPQGYYKEYVHPTPGIGGPGPQRVIVGEKGDIWYTADHYKTFQRIR